MPQDNCLSFCLRQTAELTDKLFRHLV